MIFKYLKHIELPFKSRNTTWSICPYTGSLLQEDTTILKQQINIPDKVARALEYCNYPYSCKVNIEPKLCLSETKINQLNKMSEKILQIGNKRFYMTRLYSCIKNKLFKNTGEAISCINSLSINKKLRHQLCLQRAFLASKVSESFDDKGVIFIGAFLPTGDMHAWIIEDGMQPDPEDRIWINYRPLLAFYR